MSKTICLFRHSEPAADRTIPTSQIPLSYEGRKKIAGMVPRFERIACVCASPYLRAVQTAEAFGAEVHTDERLRERVIGRPEAFTKEIWELQYRDRALKLADGESFLEVGRRMKLAMADILSGMRDGQSAVVVSHAAAICAYLMGLPSCEVTVTDVETKSRKVMWNGKKVHEGPIPTPSYFVLTFDGEELADLDYHAGKKFDLKNAQGICSVHF